MSWFNNLGKIAKSAADFTGIPGLLKDISTMGSNDDPWYVDGVNLVKDTVKVGTTPVRAAVSGLLAAGEASYELGGKVRRQGVETLLDAPFMYNKFKMPGESYADYTLRVEQEKNNISLGQAALSVFSPGNQTGEKSGFLNDWTENNLKFLSAGFDLFDPKDREAAFSNQFTGKFLSGVGDITASTLIDPLTFTGFLGKGAVIAAKAPMLDTISGKTARAVFGKFAMTPQRLDDILSKATDDLAKGNLESGAVKDIQFLAQSNAREQALYWQKKKVTNPDAMAYLFGRAQNEEEVIDTFRAVMYKDTNAIAKIADTDVESALILDNLADTPHPLRQYLEGKTDGDLITSPKYNEVTNGYISKLSTENDRFRAALETVQTGGQLKYGFSRGPVAGKLAEKSKKQANLTFAEPDSVMFQKTSLHPIVKVVNYFKQELPSGVFNVNDGDSYVEFNAFLRETNQLSKGAFGAEAAGFADRYLAAVSTGERNAVIQQAEKRAFAVLFPGYTQSEIDKLYAIFDYRRASRIKQHRDQGFVSYLENGQVVNAVSPVLQRESANTVIIADMRKLYRAIKNHERVLPGLLDGFDVQDLNLRTEKGLQALGTINDIFKTSVLMRLGYTVRNITEAQLSMLAKGFALPAMVAGGGKDAVARFFNNRKVNYTRLLDNVNVMSGRADDVATLQYAFMTEVDKLRSVDMSRQQLAKAVRERIAEIEGTTVGPTVKALATELEAAGAGTRAEAETLAFADELRILKGALADLESVTLYHGSPVAGFTPSKTRAVATSASPDVARRYSKFDTIHSVESYLETPSGRPGRIGEKPSAAPGAPIGTAAVGEQMPFSEFTPVRTYVTGLANFEQQKFRSGSFDWDTLKVEGPTPADLKWLKDFNRTIARSTIQKNTTVYRGTFSAENKQFDANGFPLTTSIWNLNELKVGDIVTDPALVSTSKDLDMARKFAKAQPSNDEVLLEIKIPKGSSALDIEATYDYFGKQYNKPDIAGYQNAAREKEVLLPAGTKFKVLDISAGNVVTVEVLPSKKPTFNVDRVEEAVQRLRTDMIDAVNAGKKVEIQRSPGRWSKVANITYDEVLVVGEGGALEKLPFDAIKQRRMPFRVAGAEGSVTPLRVYGTPLYMNKWSELPMDVREEVFGGSAKNFNAWVKNKGWEDEASPIYGYLRKNGYGRAVVPDDKRAGGVTNIVLPEAIDKSGRKAQVDKYMASLETKAAQRVAEDLPSLELEQPLATPAERRAARTAARKAKKVPGAAVSPYYDKDSVNAMINNGLEDAAENLARLYTISHAHLDDMSARLGASISRAESNAIKQRTGYGYMDIDAEGNTYQVPEVFQDATWFMGRTSAEDTWNAMVGTQEMAFSAGIGARTVAPIKANDPRYFEGWANILNMHFRDPETGKIDDVVKRILDGETDQDILNWLSRSFEGRKYANDTYTTPRQGYGFTALKGGELDDDLLEKINVTRNAVAVYLPDNEAAQFLLDAQVNNVTGGQIQDFLRNRYGNNPENLPDINGLLVTTSKEYRDQERIIDTFNRRVMRFLGSLPEDVFARHPLTRAMYTKNVKTNIANLAAAKGSEKLTAEEIERAVRGAREDARREVERTLFTIVRRSRASSSQVMQLMFPFFTAYENTIKRWSGIIAEDPQAVANIGRTIAQLVNGQTVINQDGERITDAKKLTEPGMANLVIQVPQGFIDSLPGAWRDVANNAFKSVNIPLSSLDVITQGQPGNPGFGPYAVLPTYLVIKNRPELEEAFAPLFPAGMPQGALDLFTPSALRRLRTMWSQDALYVRTFNQMLRYESYNYNAGQRTDAPSLAEITDKTNKFFMLRALSSITMPFAISPEMDFYQQTYRQFLNQYGPGEAETKFLQMYPDYFEATISLSKSPGSLEANVATVKNLKKFRNLMATAEASENPELIGFLANDFDGQYTFSQAAYQWQYNQGAYPGSKNTYRQNRNPEELLRDANIKRGWTQFNSLMGQINTYKIQNGIVSDNDDRMGIINEAKKLWVSQQAENNFDWYSQYISPDRGKYERRARVLEQALSDKAWMQQNGNRAVVKAVATYLDARKQIGTFLEQRKALGGSKDLGAKSNQDVAYVFEQVRQQLIAESPEFEEFLNRYFINDTVVV